MSDLLTGIVDVETCGAQGGKFFLAHNYRLLSVTHESEWSRSPGGPAWGMTKRIRFAVGRTADVPEATLPNAPPPAAAQTPPAQPAAPTQPGLLTPQFGDGPLTKFRRATA